MKRLMILSVLAIVTLSAFAATGQGLQRDRTPISSPPLITYEDFDYLLVIKFRDDMKARALPGGALSSQTNKALSGVTAVADRYSLTFRSQISLPESELTALENRALARTGRNQPDLAGMMIVEMPDADTASLRQVAEEMRDLPEVEYVFMQPLAVPPPGDIAPVTPDLTSNQGYFGPDPGMDVDYAWSQGADGSGIRLSDCEYGWNQDHEDLNDIDLHLEAGQTPHPDVFTNGWDSHGTAVIGETSGVVNAYGVSGMAPGSPIYTYPEYTVEDGGRRVTSVTNAIANSAAGDVVLLEMQTTGVNGAGSYVPAEYNPSVWTVVKAGVDAGVIVVGAAGNGNQDLDHADYQDYMDRGNSGSILVGAGSASTNHDKLGFSTYGSRVNIQGWGQSVFTLGYGDFAEYGGDKNQRYIAGFNGTSSASPFIASACVIVQSASVAATGSRMSPADVIDLLVSTGLPQGTGGNIGPFPNLRAAIDGIVPNTPPVAQCQDVQVDADENCSAVVTAAMVDNGSYDPDGDAFILVLTPAGPYGKGSTEVTLTITDERGGTDACTATVTVVDTTAPVVTCPANVQVECSVAGGVPMNDGQLTAFFAAFTVEDNCDANPTFGNDAPAMITGPCNGSGGVTTVTWTATDADGNQAQCSATVTVVDTTPPEIEVTVDPQVLWPPNHKMVDVNYTVTISDVCDANPVWEMVSLTSNEPEDDLGDGSTEPDIMGADVGTADTSVSLRAERAGLLTGRTYQATFMATDCNGNSSFTMANVYVPHSKSDIGTILSSGNALDTSTSEVSYMVSGASLWRKKIPVEFIGGDLESGGLRTVDPQSAVITNTAGVVRTSAFYVKDVDGDDHPDVLLAFQRRALMTLAYESQELDGDPVMVLEVGKEKFMVLDMGSIQEIALDLDFIIGQMRAGEGEDERGLDRGFEGTVAVTKPTGITSTAPNPFNPKTTITYYVPKDGHVELAVFDISGRMINRLVDGNVSAGDHSIAWTGTDSRGGRVASGVYFFRMRAGGVVDTKRVVLVK